MDQKTQFIADYLRTTLSVSALCDLYGISRKTAYKWIERYFTARAGRARRALAQAGIVSQPDRRAHRCRDPRGPRPPSHLGAKKLLPLLAKRYPADQLPARTTLFDILGRHGLLARKRQRRRIGHPGKPSTVLLAPSGVPTSRGSSRLATASTAIP